MEIDLRLCALASGSRGNSIFIEGGGARILVDAGLAGREISSRLESVGVAPESLDAVLVTHGHRDHTSGVGVMARRYNLPVYTTYGTIKTSQSLWGKIDEVNEIESGKSFSIKDMELYPFPTSHDASESMAFIFRAGDKKGGIATDLGFVTRLVRECLKNCHLLMVESNHEESMLIDGPYPWALKQRVKGRMGHLSNSDCMELIDDVYHDELQHIVLGHLSEVNNDPQLAYGLVAEKMKDRFHSEVNLSLAWQDKVGEMVEV
ncbi:MAG: MBL fold metallo-hydrolase [Proteobacteria bacterium]|nr:MBL fold metallo-hydrolase [Pseudomonadota bacterium]